MTIRIDREWAAVLANCRRREALCDLPLDRIPSQAAAESLLALAVEELGGRPCGYKIGASSAASQRLLRCPEPFHAPLLAEHVLATGARFEIGPGLIGVEAEFAFTLARDYPAGNEPVERATLLAAIGGCFASLELVGRRVEATIGLVAASAIADFGLNVAAVLGETIPDWRRLELAAMTVEAVVDGDTVARGSGADALGDPIAALLWLAQRRFIRGGRLKAGDVVLTGTCTGITPVRPGQRFEARFGGASLVAVTFV